MDNRQKGRLIPVLFKPNQSLRSKVLEITAELYKDDPEETVLPDSEYYDDEVGWLNDEVLSWGETFGHYYYFDDFSQILYKVDLDPVSDTYFSHMEEKTNGIIEFHALMYHSTSLDDCFHEYFKAKKDEEPS